MKDTFLSRFTPSLMSHATLEQIFVQREALANDLVERVRESALTPAKLHSLLIGARGIGKTHLVALVYHRLKALEELDGRLLIAWLREEEWGITSFMDLLLRILRALEEEEQDASQVRETEAICAYSSADEAERAAADLLRTRIGDRTLLIIVENLGDVFGGLGTEGQQQFRAFLQNHPSFTLLTTSQSLFNGISSKASPFYGFFNVHHLNAFSLDEATQLLATIARLEGDDELADFILTPNGRARIRAVHHLAGGNPRIYVILSQFLTRKSLDSLVEPFMSMLDDLTPYYQARMQWLSPQQRKIVEILIERRHAVPVKEIAQRSFTTHQTISSQLRSLREWGYVRSIAVGRESLYELREPLMRMCVEVKKHRGKPIRLFVDFLRLWYTQTGPEQRLEKNSIDGLQERWTRDALHTKSEIGDGLLVAMAEGAVGMLLTGSLSNVEKTDQVGAICAVFAKHDAASALAAGLQRSLGDLMETEEADLGGWRNAWQAAAGHLDEFQITLRMLDALIEYRATQDPRILLRFPTEERDLLRQVLAIDDFADA